jgi:hypothetical protein
MKKLISILSAAAMLIAATASTAFAADKEYLPGDADGNGIVDFSDSDRMLEIFAEVFTSDTDAFDKDAANAYLYENSGIDDQQLAAMDVNGNGILDPDDATFTLLYIVSRDYGTNVEFKPENRVAIKKDASKALRDNYFVGVRDEEGNFSLVSDKDAYISQRILYLGNYPKEMLDEYGKYLDYPDGEYYEYEKEDGTVALFVFFDGLKPGDANLDGKVDSTDATLILTKYADKLLNEAAGDTENIESDICSDYNRDGGYDSLDATAVLIAYAEELNA